MLQEETGAEVQDLKGLVLCGTARHARSARWRQGRIGALIGTAPMAEKVVLASELWTQHAGEFMRELGDMSLAGRTKVPTD